MGKLILQEHLKACAEAAKNFANGLMGQVLQAVTDALGEMDIVKADKPEAVAITIPVEGWQEDDSEEYPVYYDIPAAEATALDRASVTIAPSGMAAAIACGMCPTNQTVPGAIRIRAATAPAEEIPAEYWLEQGKEA